MPATKSERNSNPYATPSESGSDERAGESPLSRLATTAAAILIGVPASGMLSFLLFGFCYGVGSIVISDETAHEYLPKMFGYGAVGGLLPSAQCGFLSPQRFFTVGVVSHLIGIVFGAFLAMAHFNWLWVMGTYALTVHSVPVLAFLMTDQEP